MNDEGEVFLGYWQDEEERIWRVDALPPAAVLLHRYTEIGDGPAAGTRTDTLGPEDLYMVQVEPVEVAGHSVAWVEVAD